MNITRNSSLLTDIAFLVFLGLCMVSTMFTAGDPNAYFQNLILLSLTFFLVIVTYFTTVTTGLVLNVVFIFGYGLFVLYRTVSQGETIGVETYFWLLTTPLLTVTTYLFTAGTRRLQTENEELTKKNNRLATLDEGTDLKTTMAFNKDVTVFAGISTRYHIPLTLLVLKVKYWRELKRLIGEEQLTEAVADLSRISQASIRTNDSLYLLDREETTWGLLLFTDQDGSRIVMDRIRQSLAELNSGAFAAKYKVELGLKMGAVEYDPKTIESPLDFIEKARKQLEYDV